MAQWASLRQLSTRLLSFLSAGRRPATDTPRTPSPARRKRPNPSGGDGLLRRTTRLLHDPDDESVRSLRPVGNRGRPGSGVVRHVYVAYAPPDLALATGLIGQLEDNLVDIRTDELRQRKLRLPDTSTDQAIRDAYAVLVIVTPAACACEQVTYEWTYALGAGVAVIPLLWQPTTLPARLQALAWLDFTRPEERPWGRLFRELHRARMASGGFRPRRPGELPGFLGGGDPTEGPTGPVFDRLRRRTQDPFSSAKPDFDADFTGDITDLFDLLDDPDRDARMRAVRQLAESGDRRAVPMLVRLLRTEDWRLREAVTQALGKLKAVGAVMNLLETLRANRPGPFGGGGNPQSVIQAITTIGPPAVPVLIDALGDDDPRIRLAAVECMGKIAHPDTVPALVGVLTDPESRVRWRAAESLGQMPSVLAIPALIALLNDGSEDVRMAAAWALGQIAHADAVPPLVARVRDRDWRVRWTAAEALGMIGAPAVEALLALLDDPDRGVRRVAIQTLSQIGEPAIQPLAALLNDADWDRRWAAAAALQGMGDVAVPALIGVVAEGDWQAGLAAAETLKEIGTPPALAAVERWRAGRETEPEPDAALAADESGVPDVKEDAAGD